MKNSVNSASLRFNMDTLVILIQRWQLRLSTTLLSSFLFLASCTPAPQAQTSTQTSLIAYRFDPPAFVEYSEDLQPLKEIPFSLPRDCGLLGLFAAPVGSQLLIELNCPNGQTVLLLDTKTDAITQPVTDSDAHFLAWMSDGQSVYLKVDSLGDARVIRAHTNGKHKDMSVTGWTYDLAATPNSDDFIFSFSRGMGAGSELHFTSNNGRSSQLLYADPYNYIAYARYSPDGQHIAFIKVPDSQTPFTVGELWVMESDGTNPRKLADADAGHGYAVNWSPDGTKIAFVQRDNPENETANYASEALISNISFVYISDGTITRTTNLTDGHVETPYWSPAGNTLSFTAVIDGRMNAFTVDIVTGQIRPLITDSSCYPVWMRK